MTKRPAKPLVQVMHDYKASLEAVQNAATMLHQAVRTVVQMDPKNTGIKPQVLEILKREADAYHAAMYGDE